MAGTKRKKLTKYQQLQKAKKRHCEGKITKADLNKKAKAYVDDAVAKGNKTKAEANKSAKRVVNGGCDASVSGTKKRKTKKRKKRK